MSKVQKLTETLIKAGYSRDRAVLMVTAHFKLSMRNMELLQLAVIKKG